MVLNVPKRRLTAYIEHHHIDEEVQQGDHYAGLAQSNAIAAFPEHFKISNKKKPEK